LLTVDCQFAASEPEQKAKNAIARHCPGRNLARHATKRGTIIPAGCDRSQIVPR